MPAARLLLAAFILAAPAVLSAQREKLPPDDLAIVEKKWPNAVKTSTSLRYIMLKEGEGPQAKPGDMLAVVYQGYLLDGTKFDETKDPSQPFTFRLGRGQVIQGWDQALQLMRRGGQMLLIVPAELAYGVRGRPPVIPHDATLVFHIELVDLQREVLPPDLQQPPAGKK